MLAEDNLRKRLPRTVPEENEEQVLFIKC